MENTKSQFGTGLCVLMGILAAPALLLASFAFFGVWEAIVSVPFYYLGLIPFLDFCASRGMNVPKLPQFDDFSKPVRRVLLSIATVFHIAFLISFVLLWQSGNLLPFESLLLMLSFGWVQAGSGLVLAHELIHERPGFFRSMGLAVFASVGQAQQYWFHVQSHHRFAGTSKDASTAPEGMSFYGYLARQPFAMFQLAINDLNGIAKLKRSAILLTLNFLPVAVLALVCSYEMAFWYFISNLIVELTFESFNYVTHYGCAGGITPKSWGCDFYFSNWTTLGLSNHIQHHGGYKPGTLDFTLPYNIHYMMVLSLLPGLFFHITEGKIHEEHTAVSHA